ncbi:SDR family oxidoreductase [Nakamurella sp. A5-74]|uniref:SDR family oxidoreductase n=1 Tax=Nakamurella sp. A5-74 TaxID=3158264 RepID=A0AAU8DVI8_9ACTN
MIAELETGTLAVVTGGARGIGLAVIRMLTRERVGVVCIDTSEADGSEFLSITQDAGVPGYFLPVDVRRRDDVFTALDKAATIGRVRYAVNCAGVDSVGPSEQVSTQDWSRVLDIDLTGLFYCCQAEHLAMREQGGSIVNVASMSGHIINRGAPAHAAYSAAKAGVIQVSKALGVEWVEDRVRVNSISPGYVRTALTANNPPEMNAEFAAHTPLGRMAEVGEIAAPIMFLLSDAAAYITATDLAVDGGYLAW